MESTQILTSNSFEALVLIFVVLNRSLGRDGRDAGTQDVGAWFWPWSIADLVRIWSLYHTLYYTTICRHPKAKTPKSKVPTHSRAALLQRRRPFTVLTPFMQAWHARHKMAAAHAHPLQEARKSAEDTLEDLSATLRSIADKALAACSDATPDAPTSTDALRNTSCTARLRSLAAPKKGGRQFHPVAVRPNSGPSGLSGRHLVATERCELCCQPLGPRVPGCGVCHQPLKKLDGNDNPFTRGWTCCKCSTKTRPRASLMREEPWEITFPHSEPTYGCRSGKCSFPQSENAPKSPLDI